LDNKFLINELGKACARNGNIAIILKLHKMAIFDGLELRNFIQILGSHNHLRDNKIVISDKSKSYDCIYIFNRGVKSGQMCKKPCSTYKYFCNVCASKAWFAKIIR
jgi:hypothetical protein